MKTRQILVNIVLVIAIVWLNGCVSMPKFKAPDGQVLTKTDTTQQVTLADGSKVTLGALLKNNDTAGAKKPGTISEAVEKVGTLLWVAAVILLFIAGICAYAGMIIPAVKFGIAGLCLPIAAVFFEAHWGVIIACILVAAAIGFIWAERNSPVLAEIETWGEKELTALETKIAALKKSL